MSNRTTYDPKDTSAGEAKRLSERQNFLLSSFPDMIKSRGGKDGMRFLDLACGQGARTLELAKLFPGSQVTGWDKNKEFLKGTTQAAAAQGTRNVTFVEKDLLKPWGKDKFDFIYSRLFFQHVKDTEGLLKRIRSALNPGGILLVEDGSRDLFTFAPAPKRWLTYWASVHKAQGRRGRPYVGVELPALLHSAGFSEVSVGGALQSGKLHSEETGFDPMFDLLISISEVAGPAMTKKGKGEITRFKEFARKHHSYYHYAWFVISARTPAV